MSSGVESTTLPVQQPRLYGDLRIALASLYSLPQIPGSPVVPPSRAHEYLMHLQSRNVRRRIQAIQQSHRDQSSPSCQPVAAPSSQLQHQLQPTNSSVEMGSSWLACLFLLVSAQSTTEQLFCAQTLLHRLRRSRLLEAIDWEAEHPNDLDEGQILHMFQSIDPMLMAEHYGSAVQSLHPFVGAVLSASPIADSTMKRDEERVKAELSLLTLTSLLYLLLCHDTTLNDDNGRAWQSIPPIASTLGAAIATIALRLQYTVAFGLRTLPATESQATILTTITRAFSDVWNTATIYSSNGSDQNILNGRAFVVALHACLGSVPDTVMGGMQTSGARGRLSMDPKCMQAAMAELRRTGVSELWETLRQTERAHGSTMIADLLMLDTCAQWAKFLPLTNEFLQNLGPLVNSCMSDSTVRRRQLAFELIIAVMEGGTWTVEDVLARSLGLSDQQQMQQQGKKKQSNKTKKRNNARIGATLTEVLVDESRTEVLHRGQLSCNLTLLIWDKLIQVANQQIRDMVADPQAQMDGEGSIACLVAAASACLPHVVCNPDTPHGKELFAAITAPFQGLCGSPNKSVRAHVMEALCSLHKCVASSELVGSPFESALVNNFYLCSLGLVAACSYPTEYFNDLGAANDEDLEIERNEVRDLVRVVSGSSVDWYAVPRPGVNASTMVLAQFVNACKGASASAYTNQHICSESMIHMFSALAKSLNQSLPWLINDVSSEAVQRASAALETILNICNNVLDAFDRSLSVPTILPACRTANIAVCSLSPFLAGFCVPRFASDPRPELVLAITTAAVKLAAYSIECLPELPALSTVGRHRYDVRGAMRGPGGEDHVGCLALMRLVNETDDLARTVIKGSCELIPRLCDLHTKLQILEAKRGLLIWHGTGVTPKSRRILLSALCRLEILSGDEVAATMLNDLFHTAINTITTLGRISIDEHALYAIGEAVYDIVSFPSALTSSLFEDHVIAPGVNQSQCLITITRACMEGYRCFAVDGTFDAACRQWNRLRAATFYLLTSFGGRDIPVGAAEMIQALVRAECDAIDRQCAAGPDSISSIFCEGIVSEDYVPAGLFVRCFAEVFRCATPSPTAKKINSEARTLNGALKQPGVDDGKTYPKAIHAMYACKDFVFASVLHACPEPHSGAFDDPRPTLLEAWMLAVVDLMQLNIPDSLAAQVNVLLTETLASVASLLLYPTLRRPEDRSDDPGLSFDGPQSLAIMDFLSRCLALPLGSVILEKSAEILSSRIPVDFGPHASDTDDRVKHVAIVASALFRAVQGGLPPWAVEFVPEVYSSFYGALGRDACAFGMVLRLAMDARLPKDATARFGGLQEGKLLSGRFFESLSSQSKDKFVQDAMVLARNDDLASWRRLKVLIKSACGGKKKDSGFQLKPPLTRWDFDRI